MAYNDTKVPGYGNEKDGSPISHDFHDHTRGRQFSLAGENSGLVEADVNELKRGLSGFHTSMIAIGGAIGAGLFVSVGGAFANGGPASVLIGFLIIGVMML
jgi:yeast amino acid transporter